jgi:hypothetical protein
MSGHFRGLVALLTLTMVVFGIVGCGGDDLEITAPADPRTQIRLEGFNQPQISFDPSLGTTTVVVQLIARDGSESPLHGDELSIDLQLDGAPIDVEGLLSEDSEALASSLHLTLVLDASFSMLQHSPPAFAPMLSAARRSTAAGKALYVDRPGTFDWDLVWFNDRIFRPVESTSETRWLETDIERIPAPGPGTFTKLYAAVASAVQSSAAHAATNPSSPRDQHLVVVFSDGADNYSWFDNGTLSGTGEVGPGRSFEWTGAAPVTRAQVEQLLGNNAEVQLHVMGLGSAVNDGELLALAGAGRGRYFKNVEASQVDVLFDQVTREFTSVQTRGATIPVAPGAYTFRVVATRKDTGAQAVYSFRFLGGQVDARVLD